MNFLLAPNAMKGALSSQKIAAILAKTLRRKYPDAEIVSAPIADGGNGTLDCLMNALGGTIHEKEVSGPLPSMKVNARFGITRNNIAVIESAEAVGLHLLSPSPETIAQATSRGIGELLMETSVQSCSGIWIGLGGTATNDGGAGLARALGLKLLDDHGEEIKDGAVHLIKASSAELLHSLPLLEKQITILSDVNNVLLGEHGATYTFARQKGADEDQLPYLEAAMNNYAEVAVRAAGKDFRIRQGSGAAGGLGFGLMTFFNAEAVSGIDMVLDTMQFDDKLSSCDCVITAEGMLDQQTVSGKGIAGIALRAKKFNKPVHAFVGAVNGSQEELRSALGLASLTAISPEELSSRQAMRDASWLLADAVFHFQF